MARLRAAGHRGRTGPASVAGYLVISASLGFAAGSMLAATDHSLATVATFTLGLGALFTPLSLATGLALNPPDTRCARPRGKRGLRQPQPCLVKD